MMFFGGWMILVWVIIIALIIWGVVMLVKHSSSTSNTSHRQDPLEIIKERYAKGEINKDEYEELKKTLS